MVGETFPGNPSEAEAAADACGMCDGDGVMQEPGFGFRSNGLPGPVMQVVRCPLCAGTGRRNPDAVCERRDGMTIWTLSPRAPLA